MCEILRCESEQRGISKYSITRLSQTYLHKITRTKKTNLPNVPIQSGRSVYQLKPVSKIFYDEAGTVMSNVE